MRLRWQASLRELILRSSSCRVLYQNLLFDCLIFWFFDLRRGVGRQETRTTLFIFEAIAKPRDTRKGVRLFRAHFRVFSVFRGS